MTWRRPSYIAPCLDGFSTPAVSQLSWLDHLLAAKRKFGKFAAVGGWTEKLTIDRHICVSLARYLQWLGVKTRIFHLGDYRRATIGPDGSLPDDYFFPDASPSSIILRQKILKKCREDIYAWLNHENGQVAIYDAVNPTASGRRSLAKEFAKHDVQVRSQNLSILVWLLC
jgi:hypothetical protein